MSTPNPVAPDSPAVARFSLCPLIHLDKNFLRELQHIAVNDPMALPIWAESFSGRPAEEAIYFKEKEWRGLNPQPASHRVDLYTIQRGLLKVFDAKYDLPITMRQVVLRALYEQNHLPNILSMHPRTVSGVIQLALFDQIVW